MLLTPVEIRDAILMALSSIRSNKFRAFLTILGVMIGVGSVIGLASIVDGLNASVMEEINRGGANTIEVMRLPHNADWDNLTEEERNRPWIKSGEAEAILASCDHVDAVSPQNHFRRRGGNIIKYKNRKGSFPPIVGVWPSYPKVRNSIVERGRFISDLDQNFRQYVCVLGSDLADGLFEGEDPVDKNIRANGVVFRVLGVLEKEESNLGGEGHNNKMFIPLSTFEKLYSWDEALTLIVRADSYENMEIAKEEVIAALRIYRRVPFNKPNNFAVESQEDREGFVNNITDGIYIAMIVITSVGLMVGGIGVMNIMLVSVTERTREIGVRKAIGARRANIVLQFLTEAMTLSGAGGIVGVVFGILLGVIVNSLIGFPIAISIFWITIGFVVSVSVGLISGVYPALKAAYLDPIEALHYE